MYMTTHMHGQRKPMGIWIVKYMPVFPVHFLLQMPLSHYLHLEFPVCFMLSLNNTCLGVADPPRSEVTVQPQLVLV